MVWLLQEEVLQGIGLNLFLRLLFDLETDHCKSDRSSESWLHRCWGGCCSPAGRGHIHCNQKALRTWLVETTSVQQGIGNRNLYSLRSSLNNISR
jgi:hypothetical protein